MDGSISCWLVGVLLLQVVLSTEGAGGSSWSYSGNTGPSNWANVNNSCGGSSQSPINIEHSKAMKKSFSNFVFNGYSAVPTGATMSLYNTGHAINVNLASGSNGFSVSGGGLTGTYVCAQFHFHWGNLANNNNTGSEHTLEGDGYPGEVHFVHYSGTYANLSEAASSGSSTALAVLGFFLELDDNDNAGLAPIVSNIGNAANSSDTHTFSTGFTFDNFLPSARGNFYRYSGSLTTPGCNEIVVWTVFEETIKISRSQLTALQSSTYYVAEAGQQPEPMLDNFRPVVALGTRKVYRSFGSASGTLRIMPAWQIVALGVFMAARFREI